MEKYNTPYFLIDKQILDHYWSMLQESLSSSWGNFQIGYSFKTNSLPWLVKYVKEKGAYAEVVSADEYSLAKYLGFENHQIIYNGRNIHSPDKTGIIEFNFLNVNVIVNRCRRFRCPRSQRRH